MISFNYNTFEIGGVIICKAKTTKNIIKQSARELFLKQGYNKTSVNQIVSLAGVAKGTFYLYYETKMDMFKSLVSEGMLNILSLVENCLNYENPSFEQLDLFIDQIIVFMNEHHDELLFFHKESTESILLENKVSKETVAKLVQPFSRFIQAGINKRVFNNIDSQIYGFLLYKIIHEILESAYFYQYPANISKIKLEIKYIIRRILSK